MTRSNISAESLWSKGYRAYEFGDYTLEDAVNYIKSGCECELVPDAHGNMVGIVHVRLNGHVYRKEMFARPMTSEEMAKYSEKIATLKAEEDAFVDKVNRRNKAKIRRRR